MYRLWDRLLDWIASKPRWMIPVVAAVVYFAAVLMAVIIAVLMKVLA